MDMAVRLNVLTGVVAADRADSIQLDDVLCCRDELADGPEWLHSA